MADRLNQYPMLPNFAPGHLPQQQQQPQPQHQAQVDPSQSGFAAEAAARMWQYRSQAGGDMPSQQQQASSPFYCIPVSCQGL
jgi:hypothetical protein